MAKKSNKVETGQLCKTEGHDFQQVGQNEALPPLIFCTKCGEVRTLANARFEVE